MAARPIWTGSISFGLVNVPVRMYPAVQEQRVSFHMLHDQDKVRLRRKLVCPADGKEVHPEHIVKGYEISKDQYVVVRKEELENCAPEKTKSIEITDFVELAEIDPVFYDRPYYLLPQKGADKPYRLLVEAMKRSKKVGIARLVFHDKEYLCALRPVEGAICLETMHFGDEIIDVEDLEGVPAEHKIADREMKAAQQLIESLATRFEPDKYHDEYRDCVRSMIEKKAEGEEVVTQPPPEKKHARAEDLMAALEASLAQAKSHSKRRKSA